MKLAYTSFAFLPLIAIPIDDGADATSTAVRVSPPTTTMVHEDTIGDEHVTIVYDDSYVLPVEERMALLDKYGLPHSPFLWWMERESGGRPLAYNGRNNDRSYGLLQINTKGSLWGEIQTLCGLIFKEQLFNPDTNVYCASQLYQKYGKKPWS